MTRTRAALIFLIVAASATLAATAAGAADAEHGEAMAKRWCATCHVVAAGQARGSTQAPPFSEIAGRPGFDAAQLALYLLLPHPRMPDMNMSRAEAADLAAYIASQR
jgi:mono/diheme cytochrome c family protein